MRDTGNENAPVQRERAAISLSHSDSPACLHPGFQKAMAGERRMRGIAAIEAIVWACETCGRKRGWHRSSFKHGEKERPRERETTDAQYSCDSVCWDEAPRVSSGLVRTRLLIWKRDHYPAARCPVCSYLAEGFLCLVLGEFWGEGGGV